MTDLGFGFLFVCEKVTATDGDKDRVPNIVYFLTGQGIDSDNPANSKFDINRTTGEIFVLKVSVTVRFGQETWELQLSCYNVSCLDNGYLC